MARLKQDKFRIFISHKHADKDLANLVDEQLTGCFPAGTVECWVSGQDLTAGMDWDREIKQSLAESHLLLLLFTTPTQQWDWCLFEVGLFLRFDATDDSSVVCLFDPAGSTPGPLAQVQGVRATAEDLVTKFLRPLCVETWRVADDWQRGALLPDPDEERLAAVAENIADAFALAVQPDAAGARPDRYSYRPCHCIVLDLSATEADDECSGIPLDAVVVESEHDTTSYTLSLFRAQKRATSHRWVDLVEEAGGRDAAWLHDLDRRFVDALAGKLFVPSSEVIEVWHHPGESRRAYRPVIYEIERRSSDDAPVRVIILLVPLAASA